MNLYTPIGEEIAMEMSRLERRSAASIAARRAAASADLEPFTQAEIEAANTIMDQYRRAT